MASWSEDLKAYTSEKRTIQPTSCPEYRYGYGSTTLCPLGDVRNPTYHQAYGVYEPDAAATHRFSRHGWGSLHPSAYVENTVLQQYSSPEREEVARQMDNTTGGRTERRLVPGAGPGAGANRPPPKGAQNPRGRKDLFNVVQHGQPTKTEEDSWLGNALIDPSVGKHVCPPPMANGRTDLFDIVNQTGKRKPGDKSADSWIGHMKVDPTKGKCNVREPDNRMGRKDLFDILGQTGKRAEGDRSSDAWLGHLAVDPTKGKSDGSLAPDKTTSRAEFVKLLGNDYADHATSRHLPASTRPPISAVEELIVKHGTLKPDPQREGRKHLYAQPHPKTGRKDLFGIIQMQPAAMDETPAEGKKALRVPGQTVPGKGPDLLYWSAYD